MAVLSRAEWKRRQRRKKYTVLAVMGAIVLLILSLLIFGIVKLVQNLFFGEKLGTWEAAGDVQIQASLLTPNEYSRSQKVLEDVNGVVIHFIGSEQTTAVANRNYYEQLKLMKTVSASTHFIVGFEGEIVQCIPVNEIAYASGKRNADTIAIEYCHADASGTPNDETYASLVKITAEVCKEFDLTEDEILRHYDVSGQPCPPYFVDNEAAWKQFKADVMEMVENK